MAKRECGAVKANAPVGCIRCGLCDEEREASRPEPDYDPYPDYDDEGDNDEGDDE